MRIDGVSAASLFDPARCRMQAKLQGVEGEDLADRNRQLAVEDESLGLQRAKRRDHLGKVTREALARAAQHLDLVAVANCEAAEAIPLGLELPPLVARQLGFLASFHREERARRHQSRP